MPRLDLYHHAAAEIPPGETRTYGELAAMAGSPAAARAAGRAMRACADRGKVPWHRVVRADGSMDPERREVQLRRLRREGARPRANESVSAWVRRCGISFVASYRTGKLLEAGHPALERLDATRLEGFQSAEHALARRFAPDGRTAPRQVGLPERPREPFDAPSPRSLSRRLARVDWSSVEHGLARTGLVRVPRLLAGMDCASLLAAGGVEKRFDRVTHMEAKGYGVGSYRYWKEPLPEPAQTLRSELYLRLRETAERIDPLLAPLPPTIAGFHERCRAAGQARPATILISYLAGGINHPHQDAYGPVCFPIQGLVVLSRRELDFVGGDFVLVLRSGDEQPRTLEVPADRGDLVLFAARRVGPRGPAAMHGMRPLHRGRRDALGLVFHLAE